MPLLRQIELYSHLPVMREVVDMLQNEEIVASFMALETLKKNWVPFCIWWAKRHVVNKIF